MSSTPTNVVLGLKKQLNSATSNNKPEEIKSILLRLKKEVIATEDLIRETKIGVTVNKLKSNEHKEVADLAREIVKKWKNDVGAKGAHTGPSSASQTKTKPPTSGQASTVASPSPAPASPGPATVKTESKLKTTSSKLALHDDTTQKSTSTSTPSTAPPTPKRRASLNGAPRTHHTDGLDFANDENTTQDKVRDKCAEMIYDALASDSDAPTDLILQRARALEAHVHLHEPPGSYRGKIRSLYLNLKAANNPSLREDVVSGEISIARLYGMSPSEMASEEQQALNRKLAEENLFKARGAAPQQAETDAFQCGKCKQRRSMYYQMQTRSADEPMTTFVTCLNCNNRWKFS